MAHRKAERCLLWLRLARPPRGPGSHMPQACLSTRSLLPYLGRRCEICDDGYFGDPLGISGAPEPCRPCQCSGNVNPNAVGNCDSQSGHCLRCLHNTTGAHCERCQDGFYGSALAPRPADRCTREFPPPAPRGSGVGGGGAQWQQGEVPAGAVQPQAGSSPPLSPRLEGVFVLQSQVSLSRDLISSNSVTDRLAFII